jgi:hypothetical protein
VSKESLVRRYLSQSHGDESDDVFIIGERYIVTRSFKKKQERKMSTANNTSKQMLTRGVSPKRKGLELPKNRATVKPKTAKNNGMLDDKDLVC